MPDPRSSPPSIESPRSSAPIVASAAPLSSKLPVGILLIVLVGGVVFFLAQRSLGPKRAATECLETAFAASAVSATDMSTALEIVSTGKLEVGAQSSSEIAKGLLADPARLDAIERCRGVYVKEAGISPVLPLLEVDTISAIIRVVRPPTPARADSDTGRGDGLGASKAGKATRPHGGRPGTPSKPGKPSRPTPSSPFPADDPTSSNDPIRGAEVFVHSHPGHGTCVTSHTGRCELVLRHLAHNAHLTIAATLPSGAVVSESATVLELLQEGLTLQARQRAPVIVVSVLSCKDGSPVSGVRVKASSSGARVWATHCGPHPPEQMGKCSESPDRGGEVSFHYDTRPATMRLTLLRPGEVEPVTRELTLGPLDELELIDDDPACRAGSGQRASAGRGALD